MLGKSLECPCVVACVINDNDSVRGLNLCKKLMMIDRVYFTQSLIDIDSKLVVKLVVTVSE